MRGRSYLNSKYKSRKEFNLYTDDPLSLIGVNNNVPDVPTQAADIKRVSWPATQFAWDEYLRSCIATALLFNNITLDHDGNTVLYDELDTDDWKILGFDETDIDGAPAEIWIVLDPGPLQ